MTIRNRHSEERTTKNLRCRFTSRAVGGMSQPSEGDLRFLTPFGMTGGWFGITEGVRRDSGRFGGTLPHRHSGGHPPLCHSGEHSPPCHSEEHPPPCHSEERTTKNLRCWLTSRAVGGMSQPSEGDLRFLTPFGMTGGWFGITEGVRRDSGRFGGTLPHRHSGGHPPLCHSGEHSPPCHSEEHPPPCHSEERTTKNLRCWLTSRAVGGMSQPSEGDLRFLTPFGMTGGVRDDNKKLSF